MIRRLAGLFATLSLLVVMVAGGLALYYRPAIPPAPLPPLTGQIDRIVIEKSARLMTVFRKGQPLRSYAIALGFAPSGDKTAQGDGKTPEGVFRIDRRNPNSRYHLSLGLDYPRAADRARAAAAGVSPGGDIFIHGQPNGLGQRVTLTHDWTAGCIAVSNSQIAELWAVTPIGTEVEIRP